MENSLNEHPYQVLWWVISWNLQNGSWQRKIERMWNDGLGNIRVKLLHSYPSSPREVVLWGWDQLTNGERCKGRWWGRREVGQGRQGEDGGRGSWVGSGQWLSHYYRQQYDPLPLSYKQDMWINKNHNSITNPNCYSSQSVCWTTLLRSYTIMIKKYGAFWSSQQYPPLSEHLTPNT